MEKPILFRHKLTCSKDDFDAEAILTVDSLSWWENEVKHQIALQDVLGVSLVDQETDNLAHLQINTFPVIKSKSGRQKQRVLQQQSFICPNLEVRSQWHRAITHALAGKSIDATIKPRHLQIIINPSSGKKKAAKIFAQVRPLFDHSNLEYTVTETYTASETKELVYNLNLDHINGLVIVGGDGTVHNAIAGLMSRTDWQVAIKTPIGVIPGGTGNGLSKTLLESVGESYDPLNAAWLIIKGKQQNLDLAQVSQNQTKYHSFLSLAWGLISDADIESEKLKFLGAWRFDLYALMLICSLRTYKGRFYFIPHTNCEFSPDIPILRRGNWHLIEDDFIFIWGMNTAWAAHDMNVTPHAQLNDGAMDILMMRKGTSRLEILQALLLCGKGQHLDLPHLEYYKVKAFRLEPLTDKGILVVDGEQVDYSPIEIKVMTNLACVNC